MALYHNVIGLLHPIPRKAGHASTPHPLRRQIPSRRVVDLPIHINPENTVIKTPKPNTDPPNIPVRPNREPHRYSESLRPTRTAALSPVPILVPMLATISQKGRATAAGTDTPGNTLHVIGIHTEFPLTAAAANGLEHSIDGISARFEVAKVFGQIREIVAPRVFACCIQNHGMSLPRGYVNFRPDTTVPAPDPMRARGRLRSAQCGRVVQVAGVVGVTGCDLSGAVSREEPLLALLG